MSEWRWRLMWLKARFRGMPFGYRDWRVRVDAWLRFEKEHGISDGTP